MFSNTYKRHYKRNLVLALPVVLGQIGHMFTSFADAAMVGHIGSVELAAVSLAGSLIIIPTLLAMGIGIGLTPLVGKAYGEGNLTKVNSLLMNGFILNFAISSVLSFFVYFSVPYLVYLNQPTEVLTLSIPYFLIMNFSIVPYSLMLTSKQFTEGLELTKPAMYVSVLGNLLNVFLNYLLIFGKFGFPEMGVIGAGIASFIARSFMGIGFVVYIFRSKIIKNILILKVKNSFNIRRIVEMFKIGFPIGVQFTLEVGIFSIGAIMIGWFGSTALAAHQIALNLASLTFMMSTGLAAAATIRVSNLIGQRKQKEMRLAGFSNLFMVFAFMSFTAIVFVLTRSYLPYIFTYESEVIQQAANLILIAAIFQIFDGIQVVSLGGLRGMSDVKYPTLVALVSYWIIGIPSCYVLGVYFNFGPIGVWLGYLVGLFSASILLTLRFINQSKNIFLLSSE